MLATVINCFFIKRVLCYSRVPVPAQNKFGIQGWRFNKPAFACLPVSFPYIPSLAHAINPAGIFCIGHYIKTVTPANIVPVIISYATIGPCITGAMPATVILHAAHYIIGHFIVDIDMIELSNRDLFIKHPVLSTVS